MINSSIKAHEERYVAIIEIPWAILHAHTYESIYTLLRVPLAELVVMVDPVVYKDFITYDSKGQSLMYVRINIDLYGILKSSL